MKIVCDLEAVEAHLRQGNLAAGRALLLSFAIKKLPRFQYAKLAELYRRTMRPDLSLKLLNRFVRPSVHSHERASHTEKLEYAAALSQIGANTEAIRLLNEIGAAKNVNVHLHLSFCSIREWNYVEAISHLEHYLAENPLGPYQILIAKMNLAAAYVHEFEFQKAERLLGQISKAIQTDTYQKLRGNLCELYAQHYIQVEDWHNAEKSISQSLEMISDPTSPDSLLAEKWSIILDMRKNKSKSSLDKLKDLYQKAMQVQDWETLRDCDYHQAAVTQNPDIIKRLYYGTPFKSYKDRLKREHGDLLNHEVLGLPGYSWRLGNGISTKIISLDTESGKNSLSNLTLKSGQVLQTLLRALSSDFYKPFSLGYLHSQIFENQFYNPIYSPLKLHQAIHRLREWLKAAKLPIVIIEKNGLYGLNSNGPIEIIVAKKNPLTPQADELIQKLTHTYNSAKFTTPLAAKSLQMPERTMSRQLKALKEKGAITQVGYGPKTEYYVNT